jgi:hypothetical protein
MSSSVNGRYVPAFQLWVLPILKALGHCRPWSKDSVTWTSGLMRSTTKMVYFVRFLKKNRRSSTNRKKNDARPILKCLNYAMLSKQLMLQITLIYLVR